jgi:predicted phosphodiesterase
MRRIGHHLPLNVTWWRLEFVAAAAALLALAAAGPAGPKTRTVAGVVFEDANADGRRDAGEAGIPGVVVSDQHTVVASDKDGRYALEVESQGEATVSVSLPDGWSASSRFWRTIGAAPPSAPQADFGLVRRHAGGAPDRGVDQASDGTPFTFLHASDTHLDRESLPRLRRLREIVAAQHPDFVLLTGDLVRDSLRVGEEQARPLFEMVVTELAAFPVPVFTVPGNHDTFGIERNLSHVSADHPLFGRAMYRHYLGPDYYSFTWGGVRFLGINSVDYDDTGYYGHLDRAQLDWVGRDLAQAPASTPVVTFNHIPFATSVEGLLGYIDDPRAPSLIQVGGKTQFRHVVSNLSDLLAALGPHRLEIALGGHMHTSESLVLDTTAGRIRFHQAAAVVGPSEAAGLKLVSGVTLYRVKDGRVDDGTFIPLDAK